MKKLLLLTSVSLMLANSSCKKSLLDVSNPEEYSFETYFNNNKHMKEAVVATYAVFLHPGMYSRDYYYIFDLLGNDAQKPSASTSDAEVYELGNYDHDGSNEKLGLLWASLYRMVLRANVVIDRANVWEANLADQEPKKNYIAEARFLRAYANFQLTTLWGNVPLRKSYSETVNNLYPARTNKQEVYDFVEADLLAAIPDLPLNYDNDNLGRATRGAANALLGKVYLYQKKWTEAETRFMAVKNSNAYQLTDYDDLFGQDNQSNREIILQVMHKQWEDGESDYFRDGQETWGGQATHSARAWEYGFNAGENVEVSNELVNALQYSHPDLGPITDPRGEHFIYGDMSVGARDTYCEHCPGGAQPFSMPNFWWKKYEYYEDVPSYDDPVSKINSVVIRYADILLMLAETYIQRGMMEPARSLINEVKSRPGIGNSYSYTSPFGSQAQAMNILMRERRIELAGEQTRFFDLVRWGILKQTLLNEGISIENKHVLLPIPRQERNTNPNVANNVAGDWN